VLRIQILFPRSFWHLHQYLKVTCYEKSQHYRNKGFSYFFPACWKDPDPYNNLRIRIREAKNLLFQNIAFICYFFHISKILTDGLDLDPHLRKDPCPLKRNSGPKHWVIAGGRFWRKNCRKNRYWATAAGHQNRRFGSDRESGGHKNRRHEGRKNRRLSGRKSRQSGRRQCADAAN
jgi:hypothetical protein